MLTSCAFKAGVIKNHIHKWKEITSDKNILQMVQGSKIEFIDNILPVQTKLPNSFIYDSKQKSIIDAEIEKLLQKEVIIPVPHCKGEFISTIFLRPSIK